MSIMKALILMSAASLIMLFSGCASIVSKKSYVVNIQSAPPGAEVIIIDRNSQEVFRGQTPTTVNLNASAGFFKKAYYTLKFKKEGYGESARPLEASIDGWYWGNVLIGGLIGWLIIDPATGCMYTLNETYINHPLSLLAPLESNNKDQIKIYSINQIPEELRRHLEKI